MRRTMLLMAVLAGCDPAASAPDPVSPAPAARAFPPDPTAVEAWRLLPLPDGHVYQYATAGAEGAGTFVMRVVRHDLRRGELRMPGETKEVEYRPEGVMVRSPRGAGYLLKFPLEVGARWRGEHGGQVTVTAIDATVEVPAGRFHGCVRLREDRGGDRPVSVQTALCPDVGIVAIEVQSGDDEQRAALQSHGPPVDLGPDGVRRVE